MLATRWALLTNLMTKWGSPLASPTPSLFFPSSSQTPSLWAREEVVEGLVEEGMEEMEGAFEGDNGVYLVTKRTYQPNVRKKKKVHGFLKRIASAGGQKVINRRVRKGRKHITVFEGLFGTKLALE